MMHTSIPTTGRWSWRFLLLLLAVVLVRDATPATSTDTTSSNIIQNRVVGVLLSDGFELLDAMGPYEALKQVQERYYEWIDIRHRTQTPHRADSGIRCAGGTLHIQVLLASFQKGLVKSSSGVSLQPEYDLSNDPAATQFDLLVVGAGAIRKTNGIANAQAMKYLKDHHDRGGSILTVCTGAWFVARLGLLDDEDYDHKNIHHKTIEATTNSLFLQEFQNEFPHIHWISLADRWDRRIVSSTEQVTTTAGITAGIDGILHQIHKWCGYEVAEATRQCLEWPLPLPNELLGGSSSSGSKSSTTTDTHGNDSPAKEAPPAPAQPFPSCLEE